MSQIRVCRRCGTPVKESSVDGYSYYCPEHDEDLYGNETTFQTSFNPYNGITKEQESRIEKDLEFGESHGTPSHFFQNMYYKGLFVGREYNRNNLLEAETRFVIQVPIDVIKAEDHEKYGLHHNGESDKMYACLERIFYNLGLSIEFVDRILNDFPGCYGNPIRSN